MNGRPHEKTFPVCWMQIFVSLACSSSQYYRTRHWRRPNQSNPIQPIESIRSTESQSSFTMVEFYHAKKRRGIAGQPGKSTRVGEPKPYWPGLEIDEDGATNADDSNSTGVKSNGDAIGVGSIKEPSNAEDVLDEVMATEESKPNNSGASPAMEKRPKTDLSTFRSRKRRRKVSSNHDVPKMDSLSETPNNSGSPQVEQETQGADEKLPPPIEETTTVAPSAEEDITEHSSEPKNATSQDSLQQKPETQETVRTVDAENQAPTVATAPKENESNSVQQQNNKKEHQSSGPSSDNTKATPRVLVKFLVQKKIPSLERVVSDIRDVLLGMVSRSPTLLQKHMGEITSASSSQSQSSQVSMGDMSGYTNANSQDTSSHASKIPEDSMSKFLEICKRQEQMMDRLDKKEQAVEKREELLFKQIQQHESAQKQRKDEDQNQQEEILSLRKQLEKANQSMESYRSKLEEKEKTLENLEEAKRLVQVRYQTRVKEQFRVIEEQTNALKTERAENEMLKKRIALLEREEHDETVSNDFSPREHHAFSHRVRHRQPNGARQKNLCSLQSSNGSPRNTLVRDDIAPSSPAYNPRIRRFP